MLVSYKVYIEDYLCILLSFDEGKEIHDVIHDTNSYTRLSSVIYRHKKRLDPFRIKPFRLISHHIQSYKTRYLVEVAGVEPASASTTLENTTCLDIVYYFNSL